MGASINQFREYVGNKIANIKNDFVELTSGDIHREIGGYPGRNHRMPSCCIAMKEFMLDNDIIIRQPKKGKGATLTIRYYKR